MNDPTVIDLSRKAEDVTCSYIELGFPGLPHAVVELDFDEMADEELFALGKKLRWSSAFPKGANVNFCKIVEADHIIAKTFERGVEDFTLACGTGASSLVAALTLMGKVSGKNVRVDMPGGILNISLTAEGNAARDIYLTGPTNIVAVGEITDEDMKCLN